MTDLKSRHLEARIAAAEAEAEKNRAEAAKAAAEAREAATKAEVAEMGLVKAREAEEARRADDDHRHVYRFNERVDGNTVKACVAKLVQWHRLNPGCPITIVFDSPGGSIIDGFHLFDTILWLRREGHYVTTIGQGMAASMAGILLQAGDHRVMSPQAALLIHEGSFGAIGSVGQVEDMVEFVKKLQERILDIFAERAKLSRQQIKNRWRRKDWWMTAQEALKYGFIDEIR